MASPNLAQTLAQFDARIHRTKNRLVFVPAEVQRRLGLERRQNNHLAHISIRRKHAGRWNHHYVKLTYDNEFAIPSDVTRLQGGDDVEVKIHSLIPDAPLPVCTPEGGPATLLRIARRDRPGWRRSGSRDVDAHLADGVHGQQS